MDPISAVGLVESSLGLALQFGNAAKALQDVAGKYKNAGLTIKSLTQNLDILQLTWTQIGEWFRERSVEENLYDDSLTKRVEMFLETGNLVMGALQHDLQAYNVNHLSFSKRSKFIWNETTLQGHQNRIRDQALSMTLFLQAVNLPTPQARTKMLQESDSQFQKSNESAYSTDSIVPSRMSISTSQRDSYVSGQNQDTLEYRRLSFEKGLFMSKVYLRSSKNVMIKELSKAKMGFKRRDTATVNDQGITDCEAIRDRLERDSLLATSYEVSTNDSSSINRHLCSQQSRPRLSVENKITSLTGMTLNEELIWACRQGYYLQVKRLADRGVDLHAPCKEPQHSGLEGIHVAAMYGHIEVVKTLLACGGTIEAEVTSYRWRPLHVAARSGHAAMVSFLAQRGAQINAKACNGTQPIHEASRSGSIEALDVLIEAGAAIDCSDINGFQPLHCAIKVPNGSEVIAYLLGKGANIEAKTSDGSRPLRLACSSDPTNLRTLISFGAEVHYDDGSESVIQAAIRFDSGWAVEILLAHGADPNRQNDKGETVLHQLARIGNKTSTSIAILQVLLDYGADVSIADKAGDQMLHYLAALPPENTADTLVTVELATLVLDQGVDIDARNKNGLSPLYLAIQRDNRPLSKLLLRSGARELKRTVTVRAEVHVTTLLDSQTPRYTVNIGRGLNGPGRQWPLMTWALSTQSFELSIDDEGYFNMVCEALGDERAARTREPYSSD